MWKRIIDSMLTALIRDGAVTVIYPDNTRKTYGPGGALETGIEIRRNAALRRLCLSPELSLGEAYMDGSLVADNLEDLLRIILRNRRPNAFPAWIRIAERVDYLVRDVVLRNTTGSARRNVAHHYDISDDFYRLFLDDDMQYSCAYFAHPDMSLEQAQTAKKAHIAAKLALEPGMHVLDIGCGWGGMALTLARDYGARVTGITLSENQLATAQARARAAGLHDRVTFELRDYRTLDRSFDRIVSVGMFEHVGVPQYRIYFDQIATLLDRDGIALIHTIGRSAPPDVTSPWIRKYIFPGGYVPALSEIARPIEDSGLWFLDLEILRLHYARTIRHWRDRFDASRDRVEKMYGQRFVRMWSYYLTGAILSFEEQRQAIYQIQLGHRRDAVPVTRDYLYAGPYAGAALERTAAE